MKPMLKEQLKAFVEQQIPEFHRRRLEKLKKLKLKEVLRRKNPYLFKAKNLSIAGDLVRSLLDAYLSSQEETLFGEFLEQLAIRVCEIQFSGRKSGIKGIDLEFESDGVLYVVSIKSGPNWGNASQIEKMEGYFQTARKTLSTNAKPRFVEFVNGCCYGRQRDNNRGNYRKLCGQAFWELISGEPNLYTEIVEPIGYKAKEKNDDFFQQYAIVINKFTDQFSSEFCTTGSINWTELVKFNSGRAD